MIRYIRWFFAPLILISTVACMSSPWAVERKEEIRQEQARDFTEQQNLERRVADLEAGADEVFVDEAVELKKRIDLLEGRILEGDKSIKNVEDQDTNSQVALWASIAAGVLGLGGMGKATYGKSRSAPVVEGLQIQVDRGELVVDQLATELRNRVSEAETALNTKLGQLAAVLQAVQIGMTTPPQPPAQPTPPTSGTSTPTV